ncbi:MAG: hypothetical protein ACLVAW_15610 [Eisenbergiella massiliensis]
MEKTSAALMAAVLAAASMLGGCGNAASETAQSGTTAQEASVSRGLRTVQRQERRQREPEAPKSRTEMLP